AVAQMKCDQIERFKRPAQKFGRALGNVMMRSSMKAVAPDLVCRAKVARQRITKCMRRQRRMERGVEDGNLRNAWKNLQRDVDAQRVRRVMQRRQRDQIANCCENRAVDQCRVVKSVTAVNDAVADAEKFGRIIQEAAGFERLERQFQS